MKKFTKVMALILSLAMVLCLAACGGTTGTEETTADADVTVAGTDETTLADAEKTTAAGEEKTTAAAKADYDLSKEGDYTGDNTMYVIGATGPLTGDAASYGISVQQGAQLAVNEINDAKGLNGVKFKLDMKDDKATAADASTGYDALFEAGMQVSLGSVTSGSAESFATRANEDGVFALTPSASADNVINASNNCFRVCFGDPDNGIMSAEKLAKEYKNIGAIYDSSDAYSSGIYEAFKTKMAELGVEYIEQSFDAENNRDFSTQVEALKDCDVIFLPIYYTEAGLIAKACVAKGCDAFLFGCDGLDGVASQIDDTVTNKISYLTPFDVNSKDEKVAAFVKAYEKQYGTKPDQFAADGYDAVYAIFAAMKKLGVDNVKVDPTELGKALTATFTSADFSYDGVTGGMVWDVSGACVKEPIIVELN